MKKNILLVAILSTSFGLVACDSKKNVPETQTSQSNTTTVDQKTDDVKEIVIPAVSSKSYKMELVNKEICYPNTDDEIGGCTLYDLQSVKTNIDWINQYYNDHLRDLYSENAFGKKSTFKLEGEDADRKLYEGSLVSFENQQYNLVTFSQFHNSYSGGAHNMFNTQYDVFDLNIKKKLTLDDILKPNAKAKVLALLKEQNQEDLKEYNTDLNELYLTENFYFGSNGLVFVYAPYQIAAFVYGMPELTVSYRNLEGLIKSEYIPDSPDFSLSEEFS